VKFESVKLTPFWARSSRYDCNPL